MIPSCFRTGKIDPPQHIQAFHPNNHHFHFHIFYHIFKFPSFLSQFLSFFSQDVPVMSGRLRPPILQSLVVPIQQQLLLRCFTARDLADLAWSTARLEPLRRSGRGRYWVLERCDHCGSGNGTWKEHSLLSLHQFTQWPVFRQHFLRIASLFLPESLECKDCCTV